MNREESEKSLEDYKKSLIELVTEKINAITLDGHQHIIVVYGDHSKDEVNVNAISCHNYLKLASKKLMEDYTAHAFIHEIEKSINDNKN